MRTLAMRIAQTERELAARVGEKTNVSCPHCDGVKRVGMLGMSCDMDVDEEQSCACELTDEEWMEIEEQAAQVLCR